MFVKCSSSGNCALTAGLCLHMLGWYFFCARHKQPSSVICTTCNEFFRLRFEFILNVLQKSVNAKINKIEEQELEKIRKSQSCRGKFICFVCHINNEYPHKIKS